MRTTILVFTLLTTTLSAQAGTMLKHIVRLKGQEEITLQGMGLVVGLNGTGDGPNYGPTLRGLAAMLGKLNNPGKESAMLDPTAQLKDIREAKNVALVMVTATIPATGARQGDQLECTISSIGAAKSLEHGYLVTTALLSPQAGGDQVFAIAQGTLTMDNPRAKTVARIRQGCRLQEDFHLPYIKDDKITLVLNKSHADFEVAQQVTELINSSLKFSRSSDAGLARALDQVNIEVSIPSQYTSDPVDFISQIMGIEMLDPPTGGKVIINERTGSIVISGDVEIGAVAVTHRNLVIDTPGAATGNKFVGAETAKRPSAKLENLLKALSSLKVPVEDQITIIKGIERDGKLHGTLIIE